MRTAAELGLVRDPGARTEAYFLRGPVVAVDDALLAWLKARVRSGETHTVRVCLHSGPDAALHQMVIVHREGGQFRPHRHLAKDEAYHMIEGRMRVTLYDEEGAETASTLLGEPGSGLPCLYRVLTGVWHSTAPESELCVFHEARPGPFQGGDSEFPVWEAQ